LPTGERCVLAEYIEGETLGRHVKRVGRMPEALITQVLMQLLGGLGAAHRAGVVHRDLTPGSVILSLGSDGSLERATLIDFGISRLRAATGGSGVAQAAGVDLQSLQYLSPEQLNGLRDIDPRSNIYSLGMMAYEAVTGRHPYEGSDFGGLTMASPRQDPKPVEELAPEASLVLAQLIHNAIARTPNARFQTADEMLAALRKESNRADAPNAQSSVSSSVGVTSVVRPASIPAPAAEGSPSTPSGVPIAAPPPVPGQAQSQELSRRPASTAPQSRGGADVVPRFAAPAAASILPMSTSAEPAAAEVAPPASASAQQALVPPPMPLEEEWEQRAPGEPRTIEVPAEIPRSGAAQAQIVPPPMTADECQPSSVRAAPSERARVTPAPPPPAPMDPTAADIDQSVVDALFAPPPASARDDIGPRESDDWAMPPSAAPEPRSAPVSELQPPRLEPSRPSAPKLTDVAFASEDAAVPATTVPATAVPAAAVPETVVAAVVPAGAVASGPEQAALRIDQDEERAEPRPSQPAAAPILETQQQIPTTLEKALTPGPDGDSDASADVKEPLKRTILGLGSLGSYPPAGHAGIAVQEAAQLSQRPPQATAPGIQPEEVAPPLSSAPSASVPQRPTETQPVGSTVPSAAAAGSAAPERITPRISASPAVTSVAAAPAIPADITADDLGPYSKRRSRSRKPLAIGILLVGLVGAGAAFALLQSHSDNEASSKPDSSHVSLPPPRSELSRDRSAPTSNADLRQQAVSKEAATGDTTRSGTPPLQATSSGSLSQSMAAVQAKKSSPPLASKPALPEKPAPVAKTTASAKPPTVSKPATKSSGATATSNRTAAPKAAGKDPYNYR
jgi:serine/threonine-protein kinase